MCILAYHMVDSQFFWGVTRVTPHLFSKQINLLLDVGIKFLNISEYLLLDPQQRKQNIALTFDDGYESVYTQAFPILKAKGLTAGVFINPGFVGQYNTWDANFGKRTRHMDWNQILALKEEGWEIGSHGLSHKDVTKLHPDHASRELQLSHDLIKKHVGECSRVFSFPFGSLNLQVLSICRYIGMSVILPLLLWEPIILKKISTLEQEFTCLTWRRFSSIKFLQKIDFSLTCYKRALTVVQI